MFSVTAEKCSQSHLSELVWKRIPDGWSSDRERLTSECCSLIARYIELTTVCWAQSLTSSNIRDSNTAVCQVLWYVVVQKPVDCDNELVLDLICQIEPVYNTTTMKIIRCFWNRFKCLRKPEKNKIVYGRLKFTILNLNMQVPIRRPNR